MKQVVAMMVFAALGAAGGLRAHGVMPGAINDGVSDPGPSPEPEPKPAGGDAEAAPAAAQPPMQQPTTTPPRSDGTEPPLPRRRVALLPRIAYRLGESGRTVVPATGYGMGGTIEVAYLRSSEGLEAAAGIDFSFDRFAAAEQGSAVGVDGSFGYTRVISETSFVLTHTAAISTGPLRPYLTIGGGLGLGYFDSAALDLRPGSARDAHLLGRVSLGVDIALGRAFCLAIRADYTAVRGVAPFVTDDLRPLTLFGDLFDLGAGVAYRF